MYNNLLVFPTALIIVLVDQLSKFVVFSAITLGQNITILSNFLSITKIYNSGAAFSLFQRNTDLLILFSLVVTIIITFYFLKKRQNMPIISIIGWGLILGGTVGNLIDRIRLGYVIDFIKLDFINFPIFNLADLSINVGAILLIIYAFFLSGKKEEIK